MPVQEHHSVALASWPQHQNVRPPVEHLFRAALVVPIQVHRAHLGVRRAHPKVRAANSIVVGELH